MSPCHDITHLMKPSYSPNTVHLRFDARLVVKGARHHSYFLGAILPGGEARQEQGGPMVSGPWAYVGEMASVISDTGGTRADILRCKEDGLLIEAQIGDYLRIHEDLYRIEFLDRTGRGNIDPNYLQLTLIQGDPQ